MSATNFRDRFGVHYAVAETSMAPIAEVDLFGRQPHIYICSLFGEEFSGYYHVIDTPFRAEFNAVVREKMLNVLKDLYNR